MDWSFRHLVGVLGFLFVLAVLSVAQPKNQSSYERAAMSFRQGRLVEAEQILKDLLLYDPREARAWGLLGVILDAQKRFEEAEHCYLQAVDLAPQSAGLQNNLGNHYLARGMPDRAWAPFLRVIAVDPTHANANLQLARLNVAKKQGREALHFLDHLTEGDRAAPAVQLLQAQALYWSGQQAAASELVSQLEKQASNDARLVFSIGMVFVDWERFDEAERMFNRVLEADPLNFDILYNLGLAATRANHLDRAEQVFRAALQQRTDDVDCLVGLARVLAQREQEGLATALLLKAQRQRPDRPEIPLFLAHLTEKLGFFGDTAIAYDQYLKLQPHDEVARRDRGFAMVRGGKVSEGLEDLQWYAQKHPEVALGWYELGVAKILRDPVTAYEHLNQAVRLDPELLAARFARATVHLQDGRPMESLKDLKFILEREPRNVRALDSLGQAYLALEQPEEAVTLLRQAEQLAPKDSIVLIHYSRALRRIGRKSESDEILARFKQVGPGEGGRRPRTGLFDYLNLSPMEQRAQFLTNLQRGIATNPQDASLRLRLGRALIAENRIKEAIDTFKQVHELSSDQGLLADCGKALLEYEQFEAAREFLDTVVKANPAAGEARLDLAIAIFHTQGAEAGLTILDQMPIGGRRGDYYLLRAQLLDSLGRTQEAAESLNQGFRASPTRSDLYSQAALFLIKNNKLPEARELLRQAVHISPNAPELLLIQAVTIELLDQPEEAKRLLGQIHARWPEWPLPYLIHGIILETYRSSAEAKSMLETAIALGLNDPSAYFYLALATMHVSPDDTEGAEKTISQALRLNPDDPYIQWLAGKNALSRQDYDVAVEHLRAAIRLKPDLTEAYSTLSQAYKAVGNMERFNETLREFERVRKGAAASSEPMPSVRDLLFAVGSVSQPIPK